VHLNLSPNPAAIINLAFIPMVRSVKKEQVKIMLTAVGLEYGLTAYGSRICVCVCVNIHIYSAICCSKVK
jgi:hypothetical protein